MQQTLPSISEFQSSVAYEFSVPADELSLDLPLGELGFGSLARVELLAVMDELGFPVPADLVLGDITLRGLYDAGVSAAA